MSAADVQADAYAALRARYRDFADHEARGVSPLYEALARSVADSESEALRKSTAGVSEV